jgi:hypothetical protein
VYRLVALADPRGRRLELGALPDVADLRFGADLRGEPVQPLRAARQEDAAPAARGQQPRSCGADA